MKGFAGRCRGVSRCSLVAVADGKSRERCRGVEFPRLQLKHY
jgi:hypothetical protein